MDELERRLAALQQVKDTADKLAGQSGIDENAAAGMLGYLGKKGGDGYCKE